MSEEEVEVLSNDILLLHQDSVELIPIPLIGPNYEMLWCNKCHNPVKSVGHMPIKMYRIQQWWAR